jgi:hypothetical protein
MPLKRLKMTNKSCAMLCTLFLLVLLVPCAFAALTIEKSAPKTVIQGQPLVVTIRLVNDAEPKQDVLVTETMSAVEPIDPNAFIRPQGIPGRFAAALPYLVWNVNLTSNERKQLAYTVRPLLAGPLFLARTRAIYNGQSVESELIEVQVRCNENGVCEAQFGETAQNCADCDLRQPDETCWAVADGVCDPDCTAGADPDCTPFTPPENGIPPSENPPPTNTVPPDNMTGPGTIPGQEPTEKLPEQPKQQDSEPGQSSKTVFYVWTVIILLAVLILLFLLFSRKRTPSENYGPIKERLERMKR